MPSFYQLVSRLAHFPHLRATVRAIVRAIGGLVVQGICFRRHLIIECTYYVMGGVKRIFVLWRDSKVCLVCRVLWGRCM